MPKRGARWRRALLAVTAAIALAVLASCAPGGTAATPPERAPGTAVVVALVQLPGERAARGHLRPRLDAGRDPSAPAARCRAS